MIFSVTMVSVKAVLCQKQQALFQPDQQPNQRRFFALL